MRRVCTLGPRTLRPRSLLLPLLRTGTSTGAPLLSFCVSPDSVLLLTLSRRPSHRASRYTTYVAIQEEIGLFRAISLQSWNAEQTIWSPMTKPLPDTCRLPDKHFPCYTLLSVDIYTRSSKAIEVMQVAVSELATSSAWYARTLKMRRGPSTNICMYEKISKIAVEIWTPTESRSYKNDEQQSHVDIDDGSAHRDIWRELNSEGGATNSSKASRCDLSADKVTAFKLRAHLAK